jgi:hypothetical protein
MGCPDVFGLGCACVVVEPELAEQRSLNDRLELEELKLC